MDIRNCQFRRISLYVYGSVFGTVFAAVLAVGALPSSALAESGHVSGYILDPSYTVRSEPSLESQREATLRETSDEAIRLERVPKNHEWLKLTRPNGGEGYVRAEARKQVLLNRTYILRTEPSLATGKRIGLMSSAKSPILTGERKMVREGNKNIEWLRVIVDGKTAWVAGGVRRNVAPAPTNVSSSQKSEMSPQALKPVAIDRPTHVQPPTSPARKPVAKPTIELPVVDVKSPPRLAKQEQIPLPPASPRRPRAERRYELPKPSASAPAPSSQGSRLVPPPVADDAQTARPQQSERPVPPANIEARPRVRPAPVESENPECSKNAAEFRANPELRRAYGDLNPYVRWNNYWGWGNFIPTGGSIEPTGGSRWKVYVPEQYLKLVGRKSSTSYEIILACADANHRPYIALHGKQYYFNDENPDSITLKLGEKDFTFKRGEAVR